MFKFIYLSLIQGLTEFLPVSSSGHLYIFINIFSPGEDLLAFFVFLHIATLFAVGIFFYKEILAAFKNKKIIVFLLLATAVTSLAGIFIEKLLRPYFGNSQFIFILLFINGLILLSVRRQEGWRGMGEVSGRDALFLGILQGISLLPGISRAGITIAGLLRRGFKAKTAFTLSFLMSVFPIAGSFLFQFKALAGLELDVSLLAVSFLVAFSAGIFSLFIVRKSLINKKFIYFGYYCIIASIGGFLFIN